MRISLSMICLLTLSAPLNAYAGTVYCTNCSTRVTQAIEKVTSLEQLKTLLKEYDEAIEQTAAQLQMVQQNIEQYTNMVQNTVMLPANIIRKISSELSKVGQITGALNTLRNDVAGLGNVYDALYQTQDEFKQLASLPRDMLSQGGATYRTNWDSWSRRVDESTRATFQLSGSQLKDLEESGELEAYMNELLSSPDGQQKALMAGNQLAALQIQEARQLRELIATKVQSDLAGQVKAEKESQMGQELQRHMLDGSKSLDKKSYPDHF